MIVVLLGLACGKNTATDKPDVVTAPSTAPRVTRDGDAVKLRSVVAVSHGGQAVELVLSSYPMS